MQRVRISSTAENMTILSYDIIRIWSYINAKKRDLIFVNDLWKFSDLNKKHTHIWTILLIPLGFFSVEKHSPTRHYAIVVLWERLI